MTSSRKSRYANVGSAVYEDAAGTPVPYLVQRIIPQSADVPVLATSNPSRAGMRLDTLTAKLLGDPEQFWRLLDANDGTNPFDFLDETAGEDLRIPRVQP